VPGVIDRQVARRRGDRIGRVEAAGTRTPGQDDDQVGADRGKLANHVTTGAVTQRRQDDDGGDADRHGEHRQRGAHGIAGGRIAGEAQRISEAHRRPARCRT
jgi:hypothetical protein